MRNWMGLERVKMSPERRLEWMADRRSDIEEAASLGVRRWPCFPNRVIMTSSITWPVRRAILASRR